MRFDKSEANSRRNLDELGPALRDRILALEEPVSREDWNDVAGRTVRRPRIWASAAAAFALLAAASVIGVALVSLSSHTGLNGARDTRPVARRNFSSFKLAAPPIAPNAIASQTRLITSLRLTEGRLALYVSPARNGGFCFQWTGSAAECEKPQLSPFSVGRIHHLLVGAVASPEISRVKIDFTDGTTAVPAVKWVSAPIDAGFFFYEVPHGKTVAKINMS